jgi:hypothetical protein
MKILPISQDNLNEVIEQMEIANTIDAGAMKLSQGTHPIFGEVVLIDSAVSGSFMIKREIPDAPTVEAVSMDDFMALYHDALSSTEFDHGGMHITKFNKTSQPGYWLVSGPEEGGLLIRS